MCIPIIIVIYTIVEYENNLSIDAENRREKDRDLAIDQQQENILIEHNTFLANLILNNGRYLNRTNH